MALGNKTPCNIKKAQNDQNVLYNGNVIYTKHDPPLVRDYVETIELVEKSITKMKQKNPDLKPIDYTKLNKLYGITFVPLKQTSKFSKNRGISKLVSKPLVASKSLSKWNRCLHTTLLTQVIPEDILMILKPELGNFKHF